MNKGLHPSTPLEVHDFRSGSDIKIIMETFTYLQHVLKDYAGLHKPVSINRKKAGQRRVLRSAWILRISFAFVWRMEAQVLFRQRTRNDA